MTTMVIHSLILEVYSMGLVSFNFGKYVPV